MTTPIRLEVGTKVHTWEIKRELTPSEQGRLLQFLCSCGRAWQVARQAGKEGGETPPRQAGQEKTRHE